METIRNFILSSIPIPVLSSVLQLSFALPAGFARSLLADVFSPKPHHESWIKMIKKPTWKGAWIGNNMNEITDEDELNKQIKKADIIIFEVHGGGFRVGSCTMYMDIFIKWIHLLRDIHNMNALILSVDYSLAPEHIYPVPVLETMAAFDYLTKTLNVPPSKIVCAGDSAGGALCFEALIRTYVPNMIENLDAPRTNYDLDIPAGVFLVSPLIVSNTCSWSWDECKDDIVTPNLVTCVLKEYMKLPDTNPSELHLLKFAHIRKGFNRFSPKNVLFYYGGREVMRDGLSEYAEAMKTDDTVNITIRKEELCHDWYFIRQLVKNKDRHIIDLCDKEFASFAARSVKEFSSNK